MKELEANVRSIEKDGLVWGRSQLVAVGFGIKKLQINLVVEDEKVSLDELQGDIEDDEDHVQSTDVVSLARPSIIDWLTDYPIGCDAEVVNDGSSYHFGRARDGSFRSTSARSKQMPR